GRGGGDAHARSDDHAQSDFARAFPRPQREPAREAGERYVDREFFDDAPSDAGAPMRRGAKVLHARFGEGQIVRIEKAAEPTVVAFFPGWGEKKILARFLKVL